MTNIDSSYFINKFTELAKINGGIFYMHKMGDEFYLSIADSYFKFKGILTNERLLESYIFFSRELDKPLGDNNET